MVIKFDSPFQDQADAVDFGIHFTRGEQVEVPDAIGEQLLANPHFVQVPIAEPALHIQPSADPVNYVDPTG